MVLAEASGKPIRVFLKEEHGEDSLKGCSGPSLPQKLPASLQNPLTSCACKGQTRQVGAHSAERDPTTIGSVLSTPQREKNWLRGKMTRSISGGEGGGVAASWYGGLEGEAHPAGKGHMEKRQTDADRDRRVPFASDRTESTAHVHLTKHDTPTVQVTWGVRQRAKPKRH